MADYSVVKFDNAQVSIETGLNSSRVTGQVALVQEVLIELMSDPIPNRARGAGLASLITRSDPSDTQFLPAQFRQAVATAETHVLANQREARGLTAREKLASLQFISADFDGVEWTINLAITSQAGETVQIGQSLVVQ